jgi:hypothetical protein
MSLRRVSRCVARGAHGLEAWRARGESCSAGESRSSADRPMTALSGVRSSWLMVARKSLLTRMARPRAVVGAAELAEGALLRVDPVAELGFEARDAARHGFEGAVEVADLVVAGAERARGLAAAGGLDRPAHRGEGAADVGRHAHAVDDGREEGGDHAGDGDEARAGGGLLGAPALLFEGAVEVAVDVVEERDGLVDGVERGGLAGGGSRAVSMGSSPRAARWRRTMLAPESSTYWATSSLTARGAGDAGPARGAGARARGGG